MICHNGNPSVPAVQDTAVMAADCMQLASFFIRIIAGQSQQLGIIVLDLRCGTVIFHDNDLVIAPGAVLLDRGNTTLQILNVILIGDHNGDLRISQDLIPDPEDRGAGSGTGDLKMLETMLFQMICHSSLCRLNVIRLRVNAGCGTALIASPVVHQSGTMNDLFRSVGQTQNHIVILGTVKCGAEQFLSL